MSLLQVGLSLTVGLNASLNCLRCLLFCYVLPLCLYYSLCIRSFQLLTNCDDLRYYSAFILTIVRVTFIMEVLLIHQLG